MWDKLGNKFSKEKNDRKFASADFTKQKSQSGELEDENAEKLPQISHKQAIAIQQARCAKKLTQVQLARQITEKVNVVNEYERGGCISNNSVLSKLEKALGISLIVDVESVVMKKQYDVIKVARGFGVENGLSGMGRDVILKLLVKLKSAKKTRMILGMNGVHLTYMSDTAFINFRKRVSIKRNMFLLEREELTDVEFPHLDTFFEDKKMLDDGSRFLFTWTVKFRHGKYGHPFRCAIGVAKRGKRRKDIALMYDAAFVFGDLCSGEDGRPSAPFCAIREGPRLRWMVRGRVPVRTAEITVNLNTQYNTAEFFVDSLCIPCVIQNVPAQAIFGVGLAGGNQDDPDDADNPSPRAFPSEVCCFRYEGYRSKTTVDASKLVRVRAEAQAQAQPQAQAQAQVQVQAGAGAGVGVGVGTGADGAVGDAVYYDEEGEEVEEADKDKIVSCV